MGLAQLAIDILLAGYVFFSWTTIGYIFLRTGWPKIRVLSKESRLGWALLITLALNITLIISSLLLAILLPFTSFRGYLLLNLIVFSFTGIGVLTARRKLFTGRTVAVTIPKATAAKIAAAKATEMAKPKKGDIVISKKGEKKLDELKKSLGVKKVEEKKEVPPAEKIEELKMVIPKKIEAVEPKKSKPKPVKDEAEKVSPSPPKPKEAAAPKEEKTGKPEEDVFSRLKKIFGKGTVEKAEKPATVKTGGGVVGKLKWAAPAKVEVSVPPKPEPGKVAPVSPAPKPAPAEVKKPAEKKEPLLPIGKRRLALPAPKAGKPDGPLAKLKKMFEKKESAPPVEKKPKKVEEETPVIEILDLPAPKVEKEEPAPKPRKEEPVERKGLFDGLKKVLKKKEGKPKPIEGEGEVPSVMEALERRRLAKEMVGKKVPEKPMAPPSEPAEGEKPVMEKEPGKAKKPAALYTPEEKELTEKVIKNKKEDILRGLKKIIKKKPKPEIPKIKLEGKSLNPLWKNLREEVKLKKQGKWEKAKSAKERGIEWKEMEDVEELSRMDEELEKMGEELSKSKKASVDESDPLYRLMKLSGELPEEKKKKEKNNV